VALTVLYFWWLGGLGDLAWTLFEFVPGYTKLRHETMTPWRLAALGAGVPLVGFGAAIPVGLALLALPPRCGRDGRVWLFYIGSVIGFQLVGAAIQAKLFAYHYAGVVLLCGLPVAWGHWKLRGVIGPSRARWVLPLALAAELFLPLRLQPLPFDGFRTSTFWVRSWSRLGAIGDQERRRALDDALYRVSDMDLFADREVASWIRASTQPEETVFVWGFEPVIYSMSERAPASRYVYNVAQRVPWVGEVPRAMLMRDLRRMRPRVIVVQRGDALPQVTGNDLDSAAALETFPELRSFMEDYALVFQRRNLDVYLGTKPAQHYVARRRAQAPPPAPVQPRLDLCAP
jgi:hypothetical protein